MVNMKLFVATPCYNGSVNAQYMKSVLRLQSLLARDEIDMEFFDVPFDSLIPEGGETCARCDFEIRFLLT